VGLGLGIERRGGAAAVSWPLTIPPTGLHKPIPISGIESADESGPLPRTQGLGLTPTTTSLRDTGSASVTPTPTAGDRHMLVVDDTTPLPPQLSLPVCKPSP
jgi:hypothetical protein